MSLRLKLRTNFRQFERDWAKYPEELNEAAVIGLTRGAERVERAAKLNLTSNRSVAFGLLRASISSKVDPKTLTAFVGPGLSGKATGGDAGDPRNYGAFVEFGRRPGRRPPARALSLWVKRRLGEKDPTSNARLSFLIAKRIGERGVEPRPFLGPAGDREGPNVLAAIERALSKRIEELNQK